MPDPDASANSPGSLQQQIDAICDRFEAALKTDPSAKIEDFQESLPGDNNHELLKALIDLDIHHRRAAGDDVTPADYQPRFGKAFAEIQDSLFSPADLPTIEPNSSSAARPAQAAASGAVAGGYQPSQRIGPYKLLQKLGEGGMGEVWMSDQLEPVKRRVALKLVKSGMDSKQMIARFEAERQALAMMDHPHIAKVLDAGITEDGTRCFTAKRFNVHEIAG
ncbi:MAG: protein kinase [Fuerstiella sp.]|nr:protein kinase [Fuerstiella sp.]